MALTTRIPITMLDVFPHGAFIVSEVEPVRDFDRSTKENAVQSVDKETGELVWSVTVLDADPDARATEKTVKIKVTAPHQPVPPAAMAGLPFRPVEFEGLCVTPYIVDGARPRIGYSFRATGMRAPAVGSKPTSLPKTDAA
jgi:hypothetical protein